VREYAGHILHQGGKDVSHKTKESARHQEVASPGMATQRPKIGETPMITGRRAARNGDDRLGRKDQNQGRSRSAALAASDTRS
jgi:hypothetical protein